jgi:RNA polymerase sigma-70 factor (ECF subfamily)
MGSQNNHMAESDNIQDLVELIRESDSSAFRELYDSLYKSIFYFVLSKIYNQDTAKDLVQETFVKIWESRRRLNKDLSLKAYVYKTAANVSLNYLRHHKVVSDFLRSLEFEPLSYETPHSLFEKKEWNDRFFKTIEQLPPQTRTVFLMSRVEDFSYKEIAERLEISVKTVESHIGKALRILREELLRFQ